jgi:hypothetical protein
MSDESMPPRKADPEAALRAYFLQELGKAEARLPHPPMVTVASGFKGNLATLLLAACVLGTAALALSCSPRAALATSIEHAVAGQGLEFIRQDTIKLVGVVWQQGQEHFRQKHAGIVGATGIPETEKENL